MIHHSRMADIKCKLCIAFPLHFLKSGGGVAREREGGRRGSRRGRASTSTPDGIRRCWTRRALRRESRKQQQTQSVSPAGREGDAYLPTALARSHAACITHPHIASGIDGWRGNILIRTCRPTNPFSRSIPKRATRA